MIKRRNTPTINPVTFGMLRVGSSALYGLSEQLKSIVQKSASVGHSTPMPPAQFPIKQLVYIGKDAMSSLGKLYIDPKSFKAFRKSSSSETFHYLYRELYISALSFPGVM